MEELNRGAMVDKRENTTCWMTLGRMEISEDIAVAMMAMIERTGRMIATAMTHGATKEEGTAVRDMQRTNTIALAGTEVAVREGMIVTAISTIEAEENSLLHATGDVPCTFPFCSVELVATWWLPPHLTSRPCEELKEVTATQYGIAP